MRTTIPKTGNQSAHGSYGPRSQPPQVTGSRQNQPTVAKRGKRIGSWTSNECNSWLNGYLTSRPGASLGRAARPSNCRSHHSSGYDDGIHDCVERTKVAPTASSPTPCGKLRAGSCKKRKDGEPSVGMVQCKMSHPPLHR